MNTDAIRANMPLDFDIIRDTEEHKTGNGYYTSLTIWSEETTFDSLTLGNHILTQDELDAIEADMAHGDVLPGKWTNVKLKTGCIFGNKR